MKLQQKDRGGRKSQQRTNYPQPKPSPFQSAVGSARRESDSIMSMRELTTKLPKLPISKKSAIKALTCLELTKPNYFQFPQLLGTAVTLNCVLSHQKWCSK